MKEYVIIKRETYEIEMYVQAKSKREAMRMAREQRIRDVSDPMAIKVSYKHKKAQE